MQLPQSLCPIGDRDAPPRKILDQVEEDQGCIGAIPWGICPHYHKIDFRRQTKAASACPPHHLLHVISGKVTQATERGVVDNQKRVHGNRRRGPKI
jgi:hypothetical protein